ncbi:MAG: aconitase X [Anaerolineaceae bacterium]|nr:aconitase X [Anaerolineaceae bacterium]
MEHQVILSAEEQDILEGKQGETLAKVMKTLVLYADVFEAEKLVPVSSRYGHLVTSFGISVMEAVRELMDKLIRDGAISKQAFTADPRPMDFEHVPANLLQKLVFKVMYGKQAVYEEQLRGMGLLNDDSFTCTCYMDEVGNTPKMGDVLSWAESSAVSYANSVLGARCNRNSGLIEMFGSILGRVPYFGLLTDEGRKADWLVEVRTSSLPEAQLLGSAIGMKVMEDVPYIAGLECLLGTELGQSQRDYLKDFGAAAASNGSVGLYHVEGLTPEAKELGRSLLREGAKTFIVDEALLAETKRSYPLIWQNPQAKAKLCFIGCPHLSQAQLESWSGKLLSGLQANGLRKTAVPVVMTAAAPVLKAFRANGKEAELKKHGIRLSFICPLMYMNNPLCAKVPVITNSNKLRTYTTARYYQDEELLSLLTGGKNA